MIHNITIKPALNGYIVDVGCKTLVFESQDKLVRELDAYLKNPMEVAEHYLKTAINEDRKPCPPAASPVTREEMHRMALQINAETDSPQMQLRPAEPRPR